MAQVLEREVIRTSDPDVIRAIQSPPSVLIVMLVGFCTFLDLYATQAILPVLEQVFRASKVEVGLTISASTLAVAFFAPLVGTLSDAFGRKRLIVLGLGGLALVTLLAATSATLPILIGWRFLQGSFVSVLFVVMMTLVNEAWSGKGVGAAMSAFVAGNVLGGFFGRFLSGLVTALLGWTWVFVLLGCLNLLGGIAAWAFMPETPRPSRAARVRPPFADRLRVVATKPLLAAYLVGFNVLFSLVGTFTYVNFYLADAPFRLGTAALGSIFAVYLIGSVVTPIAGKWIDRLGNRNIVAIALSFSCLGEVMMFSHSLWLVVAGLTLCSTAAFVCQSASTSFVGLAAGSNKAFAAGLYTSCYYIGGSVGGILPGFLWILGGWPACVLFFIAIQILTATLALRFWRLDKADFRLETI